MGDSLFRHRLQAGFLIAMGDSAMRLRGQVPAAAESEGH